MQKTEQSTILKTIQEHSELLAILVDPEKFDLPQVSHFFEKIPASTTHIFVGGSTGGKEITRNLVLGLKQHTNLPILLFPGNYKQVVREADALLFLSLLSGRNPEYLIDQQVKAVPYLKALALEVIPTSYLLIDGGVPTAVARVSDTRPMSQDDIGAIVHTALAGQYMGAKLIYLEAGSGASVPVSVEIIKAVVEQVQIPVIVGGGIKTETQRKAAYKAGARLVVMGTVFETGL